MSQSKKQSAAHPDKSKLIVVAAFLLAGAACFWPDPPSTEAGARHQAPGEKRFDHLVREDFFAGYAGDRAALARAMKVCEEALSKNPDHPEALVWHGGGMLFIAGQSIREGDYKKGIELWERGLKEMDTAVSLAPRSVSVRIPRGASLLELSRYVDEEKLARELLEKAVGDYELVLELQKAYFGELSAHSRGELLFGVAEGHDRLGNREKARVFFNRITTEARGSGREKQAAVWLEKGSLAGVPRMSCTGCHSK